MKGSCLCGAVTYEVDQFSGPIAHCSCVTCRKAHGAAFTTTAAAQHAHFRFTRGADHVASFRSSPDKARYFCPSCGTHLVAMRDGQPNVIVRVASLDDDPGLRAQFHIWTSHEVPWLEYRDVPRFETWQPGR